MGIHRKGKMAPHLTVLFGWDHLPVRCHLTFPVNSLVTTVGIPLVSLPILRPSSATVRPSLSTLDGPCLEFLDALSQRHLMPLTTCHGSRPVRLSSPREVLTTWATLA